jgi:putative protease
VSKLVKILAPVSSLEATCGAIAAGADEIYCGVKIPGIIYTGLSTRPDWCSLQSYDELEKIVNCAHQHDVRTIVTTEFPFMAGLIEDKLKDFVKSVVERDVDAIIATDLGTILMIRSMRLSIPVYASTYLASMNYEAVDLLKKLGVKRVMVERHLTIGEMREIVERNRDVEIEVFVHGPGCSNINVSCYGCGTVIHTITAETTKDEILSLCRTKYEIYRIDNDRRAKVSDMPILDALSWCSLCQLPDLVKTGVKGLKIVGRECDQKYQEEVVKIYKELVDLLEAGEVESYYNKLESLKKHDQIISACQQGRCYYSNLFNAPYRIVSRNLAVRGVDCENRGSGREL